MRKIRVSRAEEKHRAEREDKWKRSAGGKEEEEEDGPRKINISIREVQRSGGAIYLRKALRRLACAQSRLVASSIPARKVRSSLTGPWKFISLRRRLFERADVLDVSRTA